MVIFATYLSSWLSDRDDGRTPLMAVEEAAQVLAFVMHWRHYVVITDGLTLADNFLTRETFLDIVTSCHGCILRFPQFRDNFGGKYKPDGPRFSSAYSEYFFQYGRAAQCQSPVVSIKGWFTHAKHYLYQQFLEATSTIPLPASCRGIPHTIFRGQVPVVSADYFPSDDELVAAVDAGVQKAIDLLQFCGVNTNLTVHNGFFKHPCKHFPLGDSYVTLAHCAEATVGNKEDDPNVDPDVEMTELDASDAADAQALFQQLMRPADAADDVTAGAKLAEFSALISAFNSSIQEESKDRKYRFAVKRLMKGHQRAGETLDEELDFYRDDDDVAVLFDMGNGTTAWVIGNIEEVAVTRGEVRGNTAEHLLRMEKDYRPGGVYINDPKGVFIFRWYKEVDGEGKALPAGPRYQNRGCKAYELCAFNDGDRFSWMAQAQLISKVYLKKHPSLPYCYFLNAQDKKIVNDFKKARAFRHTVWVFGEKVMRGWCNHVDLC